MRIPEGPSAQHPTGMPKPSRLSETPPNAAAVPGVTFRLHMPSPLTIAARSSAESWAINISIVHLPAATSFNDSPLLPVYGICLGSLERILSLILIVRVGTCSYVTASEPSSLTYARIRSNSSVGAIASSHCTIRSVSASCQVSVPFTGTSSVSRTFFPA